MTKGTVPRSYLAVLAEDGLLETVRARMPAADRAAITPTPLASAWIDATHMDALLAATLEHVGEPRFRVIAGRAARYSAGFARPVIEGLLRVFGASPLVLLRRIAMLGETTARGVGFEFTASGERSGVVELRLPNGHHVGRANALSLAVGVESIVALCGVSACETEIQPSDPARPNAVSVAIRW
jgi:hypothetical protein